MNIVDSKLADMLAGNRVIMSHGQMDELLNRPESTLVASCYNARRCGILDEFVAWIGDENQPADMVYRDGGWAYGSR